MLKKTKKIQVSSEREREGYSGRFAELFSEEEYLEIINGSKPTFPNQCDEGEIADILSPFFAPFPMWQQDTSD
ncbi:hypothetical protein [Vampirovibrio chlorellavorus]|uniref:hypothetical protein n=1 Tax=Vampirovibrio chlorellavorus TaxID=758823 RepID=UPI0026F18037|nr:hypothetical protein [Vampirovibrio chlorellavorus]